MTLVTVSHGVVNTAQMSQALCSWALLLAGCVTLGKSLQLSEPHMSTRTQRQRRDLPEHGTENSWPPCQNSSLLAAQCPDTDWWLAPAPPLTHPCSKGAEQTPTGTTHTGLRRAFVLTLLGHVHPCSSIRHETLPMPRPPRGQAPV